MISPSPKSNATSASWRTTSREKEIRPVAWDYDRDATWPQEIIEKAWEVGLMNSQLPERYGGAGASYLDGVLIGEELAWGCAAIATTLGINELAATPVLLGGSERDQGQVPRDAQPRSPGSPRSA